MSDLENQEIGTKFAVMVEQACITEIKRICDHVFLLTKSEKIIIKGKMSTDNTRHICCNTCHVKRSPMSIHLSLICKLLVFT